MVAVFIITLFGCSDAMTECTQLQQVSVEARSEQECAAVAQTLLRTSRIDYPSSAADCVQQVPFGYAVAESKAANGAPTNGGSGS